MDNLENKRRYKEVKVEVMGIFECTRSVGEESVDDADDVEYLGGNAPYIV